MRVLPRFGRRAAETRWGPRFRPYSRRPPVPSFLPRRFSSQVALTPEEREQREIYAAILEYEQDHVSPAGGAGPPRGVASSGRGGVWRASCGRGVSPAPQGGNPQ